MTVDRTRSLEPSTSILRLFRLIGLGAGVAAGVAYGVVIIAGLPAHIYPVAVNVGLVLLLAVGGGIYGYLALPIVTVRPFFWFETKLRVTPLPDLLVAVLGLGIGLALAALTGYFVRDLPFGSGYLVSLVLASVFGYWGLTIGLSRGDELRSLLAPGRGPAPGGGEKRRRRGAQVLLDTSVIIDGRIAEVIRTGFFEGVLVVPQFVMRELQFVADSPDPVRRSRGRHGLEILGSLQTDPHVTVEFTHEDVPQVRDVDLKLVRLAQRTGAAVMTQDYNLNRVASLEGVRVLNINDLASALRPAVLPGEEISLTVLKEGKEAGQGIGYLDDGTMVVLEGGRPHVGRQIIAQVTTVLQTASGRMIFGQFKGPATAGPEASEARG